MRSPGSAGLASVEAFAHPVTVWLIAGVAVGLGDRRHRHRLADQPRPIVRGDGDGVEAALGLLVLADCCHRHAYLAGSGLDGARRLRTESVAAFASSPGPPGLFRERMISVLVVIGIAVLTFATIDHL